MGLEQEISDAWQKAEDETARLVLDDMDTSEKLSLFVEGQFKGLKRAIALIAREIEYPRSRNDESASADNA